MQNVHNIPKLPLFGNPEDEIQQKRQDAFSIFLVVAVVYV